VANQPPERNPPTQKDRAMDIAKEDFERIAALINSDDSPVGIDAKKTHVIIIRKLEEIAQRLDKIEAQLAKEID
jgi:hypothetical protein